MGEYLIYYNNNLFGRIYNNRLLIKKVEYNKKHNFLQALPYDGAKPMYLVNDIDDKNKLTEIILNTYIDRNIKVVFRRKNSSKNI